MAASLFEATSRVMLVILLNSLWQGAVIAGITWCALRLSPRVNASTRYAAWTLALAATLIVPVATSLSHICYQSVSGSSTAWVQPTGATKETPSRTHHETWTATHEASAPSAAHLSLPQAPSVTVAPPTVGTDLLFGLWALAAAALIIRLTIALLALERLKRDALPLGMDYRERLEQWQAASGRDRDVRICVTEGIEVPVAVGLFDAMVLLPQHLLDTLDSSEIDQISLHELAHLLRHDDWSNSFQRVATALLFFNPAVWLIARQMDIEREVACDDYVLELTGAVRNYAYCLTKMAEMTAWPHQPLAAPGVFVTRKNISIRIERLLRTGRAISSTISPATAGVVVLGLVFAYILARAVTPVIAFALPETPAASALAAVPKSTSSPRIATTPQAKRRAVRIEAPVPAGSPENPRPRIFPSPRARVAVAPLPSGGVNVDIPAIDIPAVTVPSFTMKPMHVDAVHVHVDTRNMIAQAQQQAQQEVTHGGCSGCDFSNARLSGHDFSHQNMAGSDFSDANLEGARFDGSNLSGSNFSNANLRNASFVGANLTGCDLEDANLDGARFDGARLEGCNVNVKKLTPSQTRWFLSACTGCDFSGANFSGLDLRGIKVVGIDLSGASFRNANLAGASFSGIDFSGVDFSGANLDNTSFNGCQFGGADLRHVDLSHTNFVGSSLGGAIMSR